MLVERLYATPAKVGKVVLHPNLVLWQNCLRECRAGPPALAPAMHGRRTCRPALKFLTNQQCMIPKDTCTEICIND